MRPHGCVESGQGHALNDHYCWAFEGSDDFQAAAVRFLDDGRTLGQRLSYVGDESEAALRRHLAELPDCAAMIDAGALQVLSIPSIYPPGQPVDPVAQLQIYADATAQALADGYTGLRVAAEVTALVRNRDAWDTHVTWESLADRYMVEHPLAALCCYDRAQVDADLIHRLAAVHPAARRAPDLLPFRIYATEKGLVVEGEADLFTVEALCHLLSLIVDGEVPLSLERLRFADHHTVLALARCQQELEKQGVRLQVRDPSPIVERMCEILDVEL